MVQTSSSKKVAIVIMYGKGKKNGLFTFKVNESMKARILHTQKEVLKV